MRLLLPLLLAFALVGCRDALVDPTEEVPPTDPPTADAPPTDVPPPTADAPRPYFKGPTELTLGDEAGFRVQSVEGAVRYDWHAEDHSTGRLTGDLRPDAQGYLRQFDAVAAAPGLVALFVTVSDADGRTLATASKDVVIRVP